MAIDDGWYKITYADALRLYQYVNGEQKVNITKNNASGHYTGYYMTNGMWVKYPTQAAMDSIWVAQYNNATPLPDSVPAKK